MVRASNLPATPGQMTLHNLAATLNNLRARAVSPEAEAISEADTRAVFIEPLLHALGYEGLGDIQREYTVKASGERIDYVLKINGRPTAAVEAKSFGTELVDKHAAQLVQYAAIAGIEWCLLTNGREVRVYNANLQGDLTAKHIADFDLLTEEQEVLDVLSLLSKEGLQDQDKLREWMRKALVDRTLRLVLLNPASPPVQQLASATSSATGFELDAEEVTRWFARVLAPAETPAPPPTRGQPKQLIGKAGISYWLLPARPAADGADPVQELHRWLDVRMWGMGRSTAGRKRMQEGDYVCFYGTGVGVVAWAMVAERSVELVTAEEWPEPTPMKGEVFKVSLRDIHWLAEPVSIDEHMRGSLDAFRGKSSSIWSWFVQTTSQLSEHDFRLLTGS